MGTQGSGCGGGEGGGGSGGTLEPKSHALTGQGSLYDEVQHQLGDLGKPLSSMDLDELFKSFQTAETNQGDGRGNDDYAPMFSRDLSKRTVDGVWHDIRQGQDRDEHEITLEDFLVKAGVISEEKKLGSTAHALLPQQSMPPQAQWMSYQQDGIEHERQLTPGEMTLEEFLVKVGVVSESKTLGSHGKALFPQQSMPPQAQWMSYQQNQHYGMMPVYMPSHQIPLAIPIGGNQIVEAVYPQFDCFEEPEMSMSRTALKRQKRMIKNRESAARSRARKQAYSHELENKVSCLEEENESLTRQKEVEKLLPSPPPEPKYQLRRTSSTGF